MTPNDSTREPARRASGSDQRGRRRAWAEPDVSRIEIESLTLARTWPVAGDSYSVTS